MKRTKIFDGNDLHRIIFYFSAYCTLKWIQASASLIYLINEIGLFGMMILKGARTQNNKVRILERVIFFQPRAYFRVFGRSVSGNDILGKVSACVCALINEYYSKLCIFFDAMILLWVLPLFTCTYQCYIKRILIKLSSDMQYVGRKTENTIACAFRRSIFHEMNFKSIKGKSRFSHFD